MDGTIYQQIISRLEEKGFDLSKLQATVQPWPWVVLPLLYLSQRAKAAANIALLKCRLKNMISASGILLYFSKAAYKKIHAATEL
jgi:hypothetical protein